MEQCEKSSTKNSEYFHQNRRVSHKLRVIIASSIVSCVLSLIFNIGNVIRIPLFFQIHNDIFIPLSYLVFIVGIILNFIFFYLLCKYFYEIPSDIRLILLSREFKDNYEQLKQDYSTIIKSHNDLTEKVEMQESLIEIVNLINENTKDLSFDTLKFDFTYDIDELSENNFDFFDKRVSIISKDYPDLKYLVFFLYYFYKSDTKNVQKVWKIIKDHDYLLNILLMLLVKQSRIKIYKFDVVFEELIYLLKKFHSFNVLKINLVNYITSHIIRIYKDFISYLEKNFESKESSSPITLMNNYILIDKIFENINDNYIDFETILGDFFTNLSVTDIFTKSILENYNVQDINSILKVAICIFSESKLLKETLFRSCKILKSDDFGINFYLDFIEKQKSNYYISLKECLDDYNNRGRIFPKLNEEIIEVFKIRLDSGELIKDTNKLFTDLFYNYETVELKQLKKIDDISKSKISLEKVIKRIFPSDITNDTFLNIISHMELNQAYFLLFRSETNCVEGCEEIIGSGFNSSRDCKKFAADIINAILPNNIEHIKSKEFKPIYKTVQYTNSSRFGIKPTEITLDDLRNNIDDDIKLKIKEIMKGEDFKCPIIKDLFNYEIILLRFLPSEYNYKMISQGTKNYDPLKAFKKLYALQENPKTLFNILERKSRRKLIYFIENMKLNELLSFYLKNVKDNQEKYEFIDKVLDRNDIKEEFFELLEIRHKNFIRLAQYISKKKENLEFRKLHKEILNIFKQLFKNHTPIRKRNLLTDTDFNRLTDSFFEIMDVLHNIQIRVFGGGL